MAHHRTPSSCSAFLFYYPTFYSQNHGIQAQNLRAEVLEASTNIKELEQARTTLRILRTMVSKRMQWLSSGSHGAFGCVTSQRVAVAVDLLAAHASSQSAIVQDLSKLLSEQLAGREVWWLPLGHKLADGEHCDLHFPEAIARVREGLLTLKRWRGCVSRFSSH